MTELFKAKIRRIGTSSGIIIPQETLSEAEINLGDEIELVIIQHKRDFSGFGMAKNAKIPFKRDKMVRNFK